MTAYYYFTCGRCRWCRINRETLCENLAGQVGRQMDGGYAEYIKLPARNFIPLPEELDYKAHPAEVGVISDAIATPYKVIGHAGIRPMENVAVVGAGGGVGIHMVMMARWAAGASSPSISRPKNWANAATWARTRRWMRPKRT